MNNTIINQADIGHADMDHLLREYFQAEMPQSWPALRLPQSGHARRVGSFWSGSPGRLALAACITLLVAGYLTLSGFFPRQESSNGVESQHHIGMKDRRTTPAKTLPAATEDHTDERPMIVPMQINSPRKKS